MPEIYRIPVRLGLDGAARDAAALEAMLRRVEAAGEKAVERRAQSAERAAERARRIAEREAAEYDRRMDRMTRLADRQADAQVKAAERAAERARRVAEREAAEHDKRAERAVRAADKAADAQAKAAERAAERAHRVAEREAGARDRMAERAARTAEREAQRKVRAAEREAQQLEKIQDDFMRRDYRRRVNYEAMKQRAAQEAAEKTKKAAADGGLEGMLTRTARAAAGMFAVSAVVGQVASSLAEARDRAREMAKAVIEGKGALRELAGILGRPADNELALENAMFGARAGMGADDAREFRETFRGRAQIVEGKTISSEGFAKFEQTAAGMAAAKGIPSSIAGDLFGGVLKAQNFSAFKTPEEQANQAAAVAARNFEILDASSSPMPIAARQAAQLMSFVSENGLESSMRKATDVGVLIGTMSEANPLEAFTMTSRGIQGLLDTGNENKKGFFEKTGITDETSAIDAFRKSNAFIQSEVAKGKTVRKALTDAGFTEQLEQRALTTVFNARDKTFEPMIAMAEKPLDAAAPGAMVARHLASEQGRQAGGEALRSAAVIRQGIQTSPFESRIPAAEAAEIAENGPSGSFMNRVRAGIGNLIPGMGGLDPVRMGAEQRLRQQTMSAAERRAGMLRRGMGFLNPLAAGLNQITEPLIESFTGANAQRVSDAVAPEDRGVSSVVVKKFDALTEALNANTQATKRNTGGPFPPPAVNPGLNP